MRSAPRIDECVATAPMPTAMKDAYYHSKKMITSTMILDTIQKTAPYKPNLSDADFDVWHTKHMVERCPDPKGYVKISTIPEKLYLTTMTPGLLMWIARIAAVPLAQFYGPLKFFRRRARARNLTNHYGCGHASNRTSRFGSIYHYETLREE
jgi:hypothetical protein